MTLRVKARIEAIVREDGSIDPAAWDAYFGDGDYARLEAEGQTWAALAAEVGVVEADRLMGVEA